MDPLGELQLQVMQVVWRLGEATVAQVHQALSAERKIAYTTVLTTMQALERRGMLDHETAGKAYLYRPLVDQDEYTEASVDKLVGDLFDGREERLLCHLLGAKRVSRSDLAAVRRMIAKSRGGKS